MTTKKACLHVRLTTEDVARTVRLEEEIFGRVDEMVRILARAQKQAPALPVVAFTRQAGRATDGDVLGGSTYQFTFDEGGVVCWDEEKAVCCPGPCPC
jgi:hypothetical protein